MQQPNLSAKTVYQFRGKTIERLLFNLIERDTLNLLWDKLACQYEHGETGEKMFLVYTATTSYVQYQLMRWVINE